MKWLLKGASVYRRGKLERLDVAVSGGRIVSLESSIAAAGFDQVFRFSDCIITPGFVDVHVHLREPGFCYKETIESGTRAAARGGYTAVCAMPNLAPPPDSPEHLAVEMRAIDERAVVKVYPYGTLTKGRKGAGEVVDYAAMKGAIAFSDDGTGVQSRDVMEACMRGVRAMGGLIAAHCEDDSLLRGGYIHDGVYAREHGHPGISSESEWAQVERDIALAEQIGCRYHVCHVSTRESVALIRQAKARGADVTCETAPHYLLLTDGDMEEDGRFKMNPPLRAREDMEALIEGVQDGTIDMIATDHAPHSAEEKSKGLAGSVMGIVGLETAFGLMNTHLVERGVISMERLMQLMCDAPRARFGIEGGIRVGGAADLSVVAPGEQYVIDPATFQSMGRSTPFAGWTVRGACKMTMVDGRIVYGGE